MDVELYLTKESLPYLPRLFGQSVLHYNPQLSSCLTLVSNQKLLFLGFLLGGIISHCVNSYDKMGTDTGHIDILKRGYKPSWIGTAPRQRVAVSYPTISAKASNILNMEVQGLIEKGAICEVGCVHGQYVSSYFVVSKSMHTPDK